MLLAAEAGDMVSVADCGGVNANAFKAGVMVVGLVYCWLYDSYSGTLRNVSNVNGLTSAPPPYNA